MSTVDIWLLIVAGLLVPLAGVFAAMDAAISAASMARAEELAREGRRGAGAFATVVADRARHINLLLLLRLAAELAAAVLATVVAVTTWGSGTPVVVVVIVIMVLASYLLIGVLPRTFGRRHPYAIGLALAAPTRALGIVLAPMSRLLITVGNILVPGRAFPEGPFSSDVELREMVDLAGDSGVVLESEREMIQSVFDLGDTIVREVMVPRTEVVWIERTKTLRQAVHLADRSGFSRIPVIGDGVDDVVGVVYVKDLIARLLSIAPDERGPEVGELMRPATYVPESKTVDVLLREMQRDRTHLAIVIDEYGGMAGIVTMEDIVEEIVGEITDEYDPDTPAPIEYLDDGSVRLSARLPVEDLGEIFDVHLPTDDVETVAGLLSQLLGRVALPGSHAEIEGIELIAEGGTDRRGRQRVMSLIARPIAADTVADEDIRGRRTGEADPLGPSAAARASVPESDADGDGPLSDPAPMAPAPEGGEPAAGSRPATEARHG